jgi:hypothetical protein
MRLPRDYVRYLEAGGVLEAFTEGEPGYLALWPAGEIEQNNLDLQVAEYAPGFLGFGGNGGGELLAFDKDDVVYMLPMIGMEPRYAVKIADSWAELELRIDQTPSSDD